MNNLESVNEQERFNNGSNILALLIGHRHVTLQNDGNKLNQTR